GTGVITMSAGRNLGALASHHADDSARLRQGSFRNTGPGHESVGTTLMYIWRKSVRVGWSKELRRATPTPQGAARPTAGAWDASPVHTRPLRLRPTSPRTSRSRPRVPPPFGAASLMASGYTC